MTTTSFTRNLGAESGVQLNKLLDNSEISVQDNSDQVFAIMARLTRGRIDKPFKVNRGNVLQKLGHGEPIRTSALNEAWAHIVEALNNGAYEAVVQRLVTSSAALKYAVAFQGSGAILTPVLTGAAVTGVTVTNGGTGYGSGPLPLVFAGGAGTGAIATATVVDGIITAVTVTAGGSGYTSAPTATVEGTGIEALTAIPTSPYLFAVKHLECFNDGIRVDFRAEEKRSGGANVANDRITVLVKDKNNIVLHEITGSLDPAAVNDFGNSVYLPDVAAALTDLVEITVGSTTTVPTTSIAYGYDANGAPKWAQSATLTCFTEGGTSYVTGDYSAARQKLYLTPYHYAYISSGGSQSAGLIGQLVQLAYDTNRQLRLDIPGNLAPDAAITFIEGLNLSGNPNSAHLVHAFWAPLKSNDPSGVNGKGYLGVATLNIAYACGRNAQTNAYGFAPKNFPIAGKALPINRSGITQTYTPSDQELNALARAKINPCLFEQYSGAGLYVFRDSLTSAPVEESLKKLIAVVDMSTSVDDAVTRFGKDVLQLPMKVAVKRMRDFLREYFKNAKSSDWLVPSDDPNASESLKENGFDFSAAPNVQRPYDRMDVQYTLRYDGTTRQIFVTQTLSK